MRRTPCRARPFILCLAGILALAPPAHGAGEALRMTWEKVPVRIELATGIERIVHFPAPVTLGIPGALQSKLRAQSLDGSLYLKAVSAFKPSRVQVKSLGGGPIYLLDLEAVDGAAPGPTVRIDAPNHSPAYPGADFTGGASPNTYVALTRFAARQLYAPKRLAHAMAGISRIPVPDAPVALVRGAVVQAIPRIAWRAHGLYVTAVALTNLSTEAVALDARTLRGDWRTATFQHNRLEAKGQEADSTMVYLISTEALEHLVPPAPDVRQ